MRKTILWGGIALAVLFLLGGGWLVWSGYLSPEARHKEMVRHLLKDPDSAQFRGVFRSPRDTETWCGALNAKNSMGGLTGFKRYVLTVPKDLDPVKDRDLFLLLAKFFDEGSSGYDGRWKAFCE